MKDIKILNPENVTVEESAGFRVRETARAVVFDDKMNVATFHSEKYDYYKLPGGGIEEGEEKEVALKRECMEEIGCEVEIISEVGVITEYRRQQNLKQISYCYTTKVVGEIKENKLTESEKSHDFEAVWLPLADAIEKVKNSSVNLYEAGFMVARDLAFLQEVEKI